MLFVMGFFGLCFGSFIHVAISRFSPEKSTQQYLFDITFTRSKCPKCVNQLTITQLIPVISWLFQRGKCHYCKAKIPLGYPLIEIIFALVFILLAEFYGINFHSMILMLLVVIFAILATIDYKYYLLPDCYIFLIFCIGLICAYLNIDQIAVFDAVINALIGYFLLWFPQKIFFLFRKIEGLGNGDIKLFSALSTLVATTELPLILIIASIIGLLFFAFKHFILNKKINRQTQIPFGPCLLIASYMVVLY